MIYTRPFYFYFIFQLIFIAKISGQAIVEPDLLIIGRDSLPLIWDSSRDTFFFYDRSKAALRFGLVDEAGVWNSDFIGIGSLASGYHTIANGYLSSAWGERSSASYDLCTAFGKETRASGYCSTAWGVSTQAQNSYTTAWGLGSIASGDQSTAWGNSTEARGVYATAWGAATRATGAYTTAAGSGTTAAASGATAFGLSTKANGVNSFVIGQYNDELVFPNSSITDTSPLFIIGNGEPGTGNESNAIVIRKSGHLEVSRSDDNNIADLTITSKDALVELGPDQDGPHGFAFGDDTRGEGMKLVYRTNPNTLNVELGNSFFLNTDNILELQEDGDLTIAGSLMQNSDRRLKKDIYPLSNSREIIDQLSGYTYFWKESHHPSRKQIGLIAQEVQAVLPELIQEDDEGLLKLDYISLIPVLVEAIKEQGELIRKQGERIHYLEKHISKE